MKTRHVPLISLAAFPRDAVPKGRRSALEQTLTDRRIAVGRALSSGAPLALAAVFCLFYGALSAYAWTHGLHPASGIIFSMLSGGMLITSGSLALTFRAHLRGVVAVPARLRLEAGMEAALERAVLEFNIDAFRWNDAAKIAFEADVDAMTLNVLCVQRTAIESRRVDIDESLERFCALVGREPHAAPPTDDERAIETLDLSTDTDS